MFPQMASFFLLPGHNFYPGESASLVSMTGLNYQVQYQLHIVSGRSGNYMGFGIIHLDLNLSPPRFLALRLSKSYLNTLES